MKTLNLDEMHDILVEIVDRSYVQGAIAIGGYNKETLERALEYQTGYSSFEQFIEEESYYD